MFAMSYLNLQMFWPRYVHYYVDTDEPIITVKCGHRTGDARQHNWKQKPRCKINKNSNQTSVFSGEHNLYPIPKSKIKRNQPCRASSNICTHKAGGYPVTTVNCSSVCIHT